MPLEYIYIYIYIYHRQHHNHYVMLLARFSLALSRHSSLSSIAPSRSFMLHPVSAAAAAEMLLIGSSCSSNTARPCEGVYRSTSSMSLSLLLQQYPAYLVRITWMVFEMGDRWPYNCCFVGCCLQDLFNIVGSILVQLSSSFFSIRLVSVHVVHPYSSNDTTGIYKSLNGRHQ